MAKPLTYYCDTKSVRVFQTFAGESLKKITQYDAWDIVTVLAQAASLASLDDEAEIDTEHAVSYLDLALTDEAEACIKALSGFPVNQVNSLMLGIIAVRLQEG